MPKLWQRPKGAGKGRALAEVDISSLSISKPAVIFLPGIFTTNRNSDSVAEGIEEIEAMLDGHGIAQPDIYGLSHNDLANIFNIVAYNGSPDRAFSRSARQMAEAILMPLVTRDGKPLPEEEAAAKLRNLTLVGYSAGTVFAQEMFNATLQMMKKCGFREDRARHLLGEVVLISTATVSRPSREKDRFTTIYLAAPNDRAVRLKNTIWRPLSRLFLRRDGELGIKKLSARSLLVTTKIGGDLWHWRRKADGTKDRAAIKPLLPARLKLRSHHEMQHYMTHDDGHNAFSKIVLNGLVNAIRRKGRVEVGKLLEPVTTEETENTAYRSRLDAGFRRCAERKHRSKREDNDQKRAGTQKFPPPPAHAAP